MAKKNIITATKELVKELKGDVPEGETPPAHNGVIHTSLGEEWVQGCRYVIQAPLSPQTMEESCKLGLGTSIVAQSPLTVDRL